jgi:hypothetical protein
MEALRYSSCVILDCIVSIICCQFPGYTILKSFQLIYVFTDTKSTAHLDSLACEHVCGLCILQDVAFMIIYSIYLLVNRSRRKFVMNSSRNLYILSSRVCYIHLLQRTWPNVKRTPPNGYESLLWICYPQYLNCSALSAITGSRSTQFPTRPA